jgi:hypothetical protein
MSGDYTTKYPFIRIKKVDELLGKHQKLHNETMGTDISKAEQKKLKDANHTLQNQLHNIKIIINQTLDLLQENGCDVYKYIEPNAIQAKRKKTALDKQFKAREQRNLEQ